MNTLDHRTPRERALAEGESFTVALQEPVEIGGERYLAEAVYEPGADEPRLTYLAREYRAPGFRMLHDVTPEALGEAGVEAIWEALDEQERRDADPENGVGE